MFKNHDLRDVKFEENMIMKYNVYVDSDKKYTGSSYNYIVIIEVMIHERNRRYDHKIRRDFSTLNYI